MEKKIFITIAGIVLTVLAILAGVRFLSGEDNWICQNGQWIKHGNPSAPMPTTGCGDEKQQNQDKVEVTDFASCVAAGNPAMESYPRRCSANGIVYIEDLDGNSKINVYSPMPNEIINTSLSIAGEARGDWYFEASFPIKLEDEEGNIMAQTIATAQGEWMTENMVLFTAELSFDPKDKTKGFLLLAKDNPSGLPENDESIKIPVLFSSEELTTVKIYFGKYSPDSSMAECDQVYAVERFVPENEAIGKAALEQLLLGPTEDELKEYFTSINSGVKINSLTIGDGVAKVDFDKQIEYQLGGSCRVISIRAQIEQTLKQFPTVKEVVISVDGRVEDALQP